MKKISDKKLKKTIIITASSIIIWELVWKKLMLDYPWIFFTWRKSDTIYDLFEFTNMYSWIFEIAKIVMCTSIVILLHRYWKKQENEDTKTSDQENETIE